MNKDDPLSIFQGMTSLGREIQPAKPGRPTLSNVGRVQTKLWFQSVKVISGLSSAYAIEMKIDGDRIRARDIDIMRPRKWDQYAIAKATPHGRKGSTNAVDEAERHFPGSAIFYRSIAWQALKGEPLTLDDIDAGLQELGPQISTLLYELVDSNCPNQKCQKALDQSTIDSILKFGDFFALSALILLIAQSSVMASPLLRELAQEGYANLLPRLRADPVVAHVLPELMLVMDSAFKHWAFLSPNRRLDIVIPSIAMLNFHDNLQTIELVANAPKSITD